MIRRFFRLGFYTFKSMFLFMNPVSYLTVLIIGPLSSLLFYFLIHLNNISNGNEIQAVLIGNCIVLCYVCSFFNQGCIMQTDRDFGTIYSIVSSPMNKMVILASRGALFAVDGLLTSFLGVAFTKVLIYRDMIVSKEIIISILLANLSVAAMGCFMSMFGLILRDTNLILNLWNMIFMLFCGINFSTDLLPKPLQCISRLLPITNSMKAINQFVSGGKLRDGVKCLGYEAIIVVMYYTLAFFLLKYIEKMSRRKGTMEYI